jgi:hypothetical protein
MRRLVLAITGLGLALGGPVQAQKAERILGAWVQVGPGWSATLEQPWTVMIFNADGTFCGGAKKDNRYADGLYEFDGELLTTIGNTGRLTERTVAFGAGGNMVWNDPQVADPVVMDRTDLFADCAALKAHQGR